MGWSRSCVMGGCGSCVGHGRMWVMCRSWEDVGHVLVMRGCGSCVGRGCGSCVGRGCGSCVGRGCGSCVGNGCESCVGNGCESCMGHVSVMRGWGSCVSMSLTNDLKYNPYCCLACHLASIEMSKVNGNPRI